MSEIYNRVLTDTTKMRTVSYQIRGVSVVSRGSLMWSLRQGRGRCEMVSKGNVPPPVGSRNDTRGNKRHREVGLRTKRGGVRKVKLV